MKVRKIVAVKKYFFYCVMVGSSLYGVSNNSKSPLLITTEMIADGAVRKPKMGLRAQAAINQVQAATPANTPHTLVLRDGSGDFSAGTITATLSGNAASANDFSGTLSGDVTGTQGATVVTSVGGASASDIANAVTAVENASSSDTAHTLVLRDGSGNFSAGIITATLSGSATSATNFTASMSGDVTGTQGATVVTSVGGASASDIANAVTAVDNASSSGTANTLVLLDDSGNFSAGTITATLSGRATSATSFSGDLSGDVTGTQGVTVVATVGGASASSIASAVTTVNAATASSTPNTLVLRDSSGDIGLQVLSSPLSPSVNSPLSVGLVNPLSIAMSPNNNFLAILGGNDPKSIAVYSFDSVTGQASQVTGSPFSSSALNEADTLAFSPDGRFLASVTCEEWSKVFIFDFNQTTGQVTELANYDVQGYGHGVCYSPNGQLLAVANTGSGTISVFFVDGDTGELTSASVSAFTPNSALYMQFSPDGQYLAATNPGSNSITIYAVDYQAGTLTQISGSPFSLQSQYGNGSEVYPFMIAYSPNGKYLAVTNISDYSVNFFTVNSETGAITFSERLFAYLPEGLAFSPDSNYLAVSAIGQPPHGNITLYSINQISGELATISDQLTNFDVGIYPYRLAFSPDGNMLTVLDQADDQIKTVTDMNDVIYVNEHLSIGGDLIMPNAMAGGSALRMGKDPFMHNAGVRNTFVGQSAGDISAQGINNTGLGASSLGGCTTGSNNVALGAYAGQSLQSGSGNIYIAADAASATESNTIRIGDGASQCFISGIDGVTSSGGVEVFINSNGQLGTVTSSREYKQNINDLNGLTDRLMKLRPVEFTYKPEIDPSGLRQYGLIAEEVAAIFPELVVRKRDGSIQSVRYHELSSLLLAEYQEQQRLMSDFKARIEKLEAA